MNVGMAAFATYEECVGADLLKGFSRMHQKLEEKR
jgi:hypothetical protein